MGGPQQSAGKTFGNYELVRELGRGGMGVVYKAHEISLQRMVALKILPPKLAEDAAFVKRFVREARAGARLSHPNIVPIFAVGEHDGAHYIAMDYVKGESLAEVIARDGQIDTDRALDIVRQIAAGLAEAHRNGVIHRDIKPHNIMVDEAGRVRILDFGLARILTSKTQLTSAGESMGTPSYMSPEQCHAADVDQRTDIYSLGVTLYQMLTGELPFKADSPMATMFQIVKGEYRTVTELNSSVPKSVVQILERMMATDPKNRYADTKALLKDLKAVSRGVALPAPAPVPVPMAPIDLNSRFGDDTIRPSSAFQAIPEARTSSRMPNPRFIAVGVAVVLVGLGIFLVLRSGILSPVPVLEVRAYPEHIVHFPDDRQVGTLRLKDWNSDAAAYLNDVPKPARGDFTVPEGKYLSLNLTIGTGEELRFLDDLAPTDLQGIYFNGSPVTDEDLKKHVKHLTGLRTLTFRNTRVTGEGLVHLKPLKNLNLLFFVDGNIGGEGLVHLEHLDSLTHLRFEGRGLRDEDLRYLGALTALKQLHINNNSNIRGAGFASLENLTQLWRVNLAGSGFTDEGLEHIAKLTNLTWLELSYTKVNDKGLALLPSLTRLDHLILNGLENQVSDDGMRHVARLPSLVSLSIPFCDVTAEGIRHLSSSPSLDRINIGGSSLTPAMVDALKDIPKLRQLHNHREDAIPLAAIPLLEHWTGLERLMLKGDAVDDSYVDALSRLTQLKVLDLSISKMSAAGLGQLRRNLPDTEIVPH